MKIAISGLGKMGAQLAQKLKEGGHEVIGHDINKAAVDASAAVGVIPAYTKHELVQKFNGDKVVVWVMIPSQIIDDQIADWSLVLPEGSVIIDGGNSDYRGDKKRAELVREAGSELVDIGTSGGVWGYENGFSMMLGGSRAEYDELRPILETLAAPRGGFEYFGEHGSGHYVKMVHNGIEYGMMQALAEGYTMLKEGPYKGIDLAAAGDVWQKSSVVTSWLNDLTRQALHADPEMNGVEGVVAASGEALWTIETAHSEGITLPVMEASLQVRTDSQNGQISFTTKLLAAMRNKFGGHDINGKQ